jgi:hypothetical protein
VVRPSRRCSKGQVWLLAALVSLILWVVLASCGWIILLLLLPA